MFSRKITRRALIGSFLAAPFLAAADARWLEPGWLKLRRLRLGSGKPTHRLVHFTDLHHKGDRDYLLSVVKRINAVSPDFVCFTGDLIEEQKYLPEALELLGQIKSPLYGVPGNHDYWSKAAFNVIGKTFEATGGAWLVDQQVVTKGGQFSLIGAAAISFRQPALKLNPATRNLLMMHYPAWVAKLGGQKFELLLAGHSHGGQVRLPFYGPLFVPFGVEQYDLGLFHTPSGPLYVNPGIGWFPWPLRFNCRPEITVIEI